MSKAEQEKIRQKVAHILNKVRKENKGALTPSPGIRETTPATGRAWHEKGFFWGTAGLWATCVIGGIGLGQAAYVTVARSVFLVGAPFGLIAVWCVFELLRSRIARVSLRLICSIACIGVTVMIAKYTIRLPMELTVKQQMEFTKVLKSVFVRPPAYTIISCPDGDSQTCLFAATFIPIFQRAGWKVGSPDGPEVERARVKVPEKGVNIVAYGPPKVDPQDPDHGVWTEMNPWTQTVHTAFALVDITPSEQNDPLLPHDRIRIYFGSVPEQ
jgi:hypothetical protein